MMWRLFSDIAFLVLFPPLLLGVINKTKAWFAGRHGSPLLQTYFDIYKLLRKGAVYSRTTTWIFRAGPLVSLGSVLTAGFLIPLSTSTAMLGFDGDIVLFAYLLSVGRFFTMAAALDTGSSFEGMGASREAAYSALAEPVLFCVLAILCVSTQSISFSVVWSTLFTSPNQGSPVAILLAAFALWALLLVENSRIPVDDPNTHLELTMIHEVMVLDHGGPDFALILYGSAIKLFVIGALLIHLLPLSLTQDWQRLVLVGLGQICIAIIIGVIESVTARLRLIRLPQFIVGAGVLACIGLTLVFFQQ